MVAMTSLTSVQKGARRELPRTRQQGNVRSKFSIFVAIHPTIVVILVFLAKFMLFCVWYKINTSGRYLFFLRKGQVVIHLHSVIIDVVCYSCCCCLCFCCYLLFVMLLVMMLVMVMMLLLFVIDDVDVDIDIVFCCLLLMMMMLNGGDVEC